ncbi:MAG TPA: FixH family protein [Bdellovibrionales bacterium]|nr:FixH family protein [Bdellovibrionales bacterium]
MKQLLFLMLATFSLKSFADVTFSNGLVASTVWETELKTKTPAVLRLEFTQDEKVVALAQAPLVTPKMKMGHHEHGTAPVEIAEVGTGIYRVSDMKLFMAGTWSIDIAVDGEVQTFTVEVEE